MRCWTSDHDARNKDFFEDKDYGGFPALSIRFYPSARESLGFEALVFYSSNENSHFNLPVVEHTYHVPLQAQPRPTYPHLPGSTLPEGFSVPGSTLVRNANSMASTRGTAR